MHFDDGKSYICGMGNAAVKKHMICAAGDSCHDNWSGNEDDKRSRRRRRRWSAGTNRGHRHESVREDPQTQSLLIQSVCTCEL